MDSPASPTRPRAIAFDVIGTLFSLDKLTPALAEVGLPPAVTPDHLLALVLRDAMALDAAGSFRPFRPTAEGTLAVLLADHNLPATPAILDRVLSTFAELDPHPDTAAALRLARDAGVKVAALTNGSPDATRSLLAHAGLTGAVGEVLTVEAVGHFKPHPAVYRHAAEALGLAPRALALVAAHAWDAQGATAAGLTAAWFPRPPTRVYHPAMPTPAVQAAGLLPAVEQLLALPTA